MHFQSTYQSLLSSVKSCCYGFAMILVFVFAGPPALISRVSSIIENFFSTLAILASICLYLSSLSFFQWLSSFHEAGFRLSSCLIVENCPSFHPFSLSNFPSSSSDLLIALIISFLKIIASSLGRDGLLSHTSISYL